MVVKKDETKKNKANSKKTSIEKNVKTSAKKSAINKLKAEVKDVKETKKKDQDSQKQQMSSEQENKNAPTAKSFSVKIDNKKIQNVGKIGEVNNGIARATGHRKRAIAKVICKEKSGKLIISVNNMDYKQFFTKLLHQDIVCAPFALLQIKTGYTVNAEVFGGGKSGQADALKLGLSRCLSLLSKEYSTILRKHSFLTRDARKVEPKKAGLKKARKKEQFSKR